MATGPLKGAMLQFFADSTNFTRRWAAALLPSSGDMPARSKLLHTQCQPCRTFHLGRDVVGGLLWLPALTSLSSVQHTCFSPPSRLTDVRANAKFSSPYATAEDTASVRHSPLSALRCPAWL